MINIEQEWESFAKKVLPSDAPALQIQEMRRAFYAGFQTVLVALCDISVGDEDRAVESLEDLHRQCGEFAELVMLGKA